VGTLIYFPKLQDFITLFLSIVLEALPFVVLGVIVSVLMALFIPQQKVLKLLPKNRFASHILLSLVGMLMPVCECGNVPVARRLIKNGFSVSHAMTFLLAAPIINPITFLTTWQAFSPDTSIAFLRIGAGFVIVNIIGILLSLKKDQKTYLTKRFEEEVATHTDDHHSSKFARGLDIFQSEFILIMKMLCFGALIAALVQSFVPRDAILALGQNNVLSVVAMMILAFVISICSTVDAFVALSYVGTFTIGSILSFLIFGPMIDIKMLVMMKSMFTTRVLIIVTSLAAFLTLCVGVIVNILR